VRLAFLITDAEPHLDYGRTYTYVDAMKDAKAAGIKLFTIGTGGLPLAGEYVLRQVSQYTHARYIFLTYGEKGESEGGAEGSVSHHSGANYSTDKLESVVIRFAREELSDFVARPLEEGEEYFEALRRQDEKKDETVRKIFDMAVSQLLDYSSWHIPDGTAVAVLPLSAPDGRWRMDAEYFSERLAIAVKSVPALRLVERKDLQSVLAELSLSLQSLAEDESAARVGRLLGSRLLATGSLYGKDAGCEIFLKLISVETGEILAMTRLKLAAGLGPSR
jgi:hypothetical protein